VVGAAYQFAATSDKEAAYNHQWLVTMRIPFF
jgi:hypothetical protein